MDLESVRLFVDTMKFGSFAAVARERDVDPSSVSRSIANLESRLGFQLFHRSTRKLSPTEAGAEYLSRVEDLIQAFDTAAVQALDLVSEPTGSLRVTACTSLGQRVLAPLLSTFCTRYPDLVVELILSDSQIDLIEEKIDIAIRFGSEPQTDFLCGQLVPRRFHVCASPTWVEAHGQLKHPQELTNHKCLLFPIAGYRKAWKFRQVDQPEFSVPVQAKLFISHGLTMTACTVAGLGPSLLPDWLCKQECDQGLLIDLFPDYETTATEFETAAWIIFPKKDYLPMKARVFADFLKENIKGFA